MKKLIMFAAVAALAFASQAASVDWEIAAKSWTLSDGSKPNGATVYLFDTTASGYSDFVAALTGGTLGDSISASTITSAAGYVDSATTYSSTKTTLLNVNYGKVSTTTSTISGEEGARAFAIIVLDGQNYKVSGTMNGTVYTDPDDASTTLFASTAMSSSWAEYTAASGDVPEPTSGLLLVLGGAMLALRRRR